MIEFQPFLVLTLGAVGVGCYALVDPVNVGLKVQPVAELEICGHSQPNTSDKTCIVDGDTLWLKGMNIRLKGFDTPESRTNICGSFGEIELAYAATDRLKELLNGSVWTIETFGMDDTGSRRLATIFIGEEDVGDILIREGLARKWPDGEEFWCS